MSLLRLKQIDPSQLEAEGARRGMRDLSRTTGDRFRTFQTQMRLAAVVFPGTAILRFD